MDEECVDVNFESTPNLYLTYVYITLLEQRLLQHYFLEARWRSMDEIFQN